MQRSWLLMSIVLLAVLAAGFSPSFAGSLSVRWDAVADSDLAGYNVYYGPTAGSHQNKQTVGIQTSTTLTVTDCQVHYVGVRAYDTGNLESTADSNSVRGFPRPVVSSLNSNTIRQGETKSFIVYGNNFDAGVAGDASRPRARVKTGNAGLTVGTPTINSCGQLTVSITASATAPTGYTSLSVENPDLSYSNPAAYPWVYGTLANAINVTGTSSFAVSSTSPAAGATNVATSVRPTVTFNASVNAATATKTTVWLEDSAGVRVTHATSSPTTSGSTVTITPAAALTAGKTYRIRVLGGTSGVKDTTGRALASDYTQSPGFTTASSTNVPVDLTGWRPAAGEQNVSATAQTVRINYNRDISTLWTAMSKAELQQVFRVLRAGAPLAQRSYSPHYENGGRTVVITLDVAPGAYRTFQTQQVALPQKGRDALANAGIPLGEMGTTQTQSPGWTTGAATASALTSATAEPQTATTSRTMTTAAAPAEGTTDAASQDLTAAAGTTLPAGNTNVALGSEFVLTFDGAIAPGQALATYFRIVSSTGTQVTLAKAPVLSNGDRSVTLTPAQPLEPGRRYTISVRPGLRLGTTTLATQIDIPIATEVSGASQGTSLSVAP